LFDVGCTDCWRRARCVCGTVDVGVEEDVNASGVEAEGRTSVPVEGGVAHQLKVMNSNSILTMGWTNGEPFSERPPLTGDTIPIKLR
jgi:hypothetical protein